MIIEECKPGKASKKKSLYLPVKWRWEEEVPVAAGFEEWKQLSLVGKIASQISLDYHGNKAAWLEQLLIEVWFQHFWSFLHDLYSGCFCIW